MSYPIPYFFVIPDTSLLQYIRCVFHFRSLMLRFVTVDASLRRYP